MGDGQALLQRDTEHLARHPFLVCCASLLKPWLWNWNPTPAGEKGHPSWLRYFLIPHPQTALLTWCRGRDCGGNDYLPALLLPHPNLCFSLDIHREFRLSIPSTVRSMKEVRLTVGNIAKRLKLPLTAEARKGI